MGAVKEMLNNELSKANMRAQHKGFVDWIGDLIPLDIPQGQRVPLDAVQVGNDWYTVAQLDAAWSDYVDAGLPDFHIHEYICDDTAIRYIHTQATQGRGIRITEEINGRIVGMSPAYSVTTAALALHAARTNFPRPDHTYRVWRILDGGRRARCIGEMPAYYPAAPLADIPADTSPGPMLHAADFKA